jgi:hypothetical protein
VTHRNKSTLSSIVAPTISRGAIVVAVVFGIGIGIGIGSDGIGTKYLTCNFPDQVS